MKGGDKFLAYPICFLSKDWRSIVAHVQRPGRGGESKVGPEPGGPRLVEELG